MPEKSSRYKSTRSIFWPVVLIGAGVILLLYNLGIVPVDNLWMVFQLWPVLLVMIGLDILFSGRMPLIGGLLGLLMVAGVIWVLLNGGNLGIANNHEPIRETFTVDAGEASSVTFDLDLSDQEAKVFALIDSPNLIEADIGHFNNVELTVTGSEEKIARLSQTGIPTWLYGMIPAREEVRMDWEIGLSSTVPYKLSVDGGTGGSELDLRGIQLERFLFDGSTGASRILLPADRDGYEVRIEMSAGAVDIVLPAESNLTLRLDGSTGQVTLHAPEGAALSVEVLGGGTGDLIVPEWLTKVSGQGGRDEGVYQTRGFEAATYQLKVIIEDISTGNVVIE